MADEGTAAVAAGTPAEGSGESFDPSTVVAPPRTSAKYETQLPREFQGDDFAGIETLTELYKKYKSYKETAETKKDTVSIPTKDSSAEEIGEFYKRLGRPETADAYSLSDYDYTPDEISDSKKAFMKEAFRVGLSQNQANNMWKNFLASKGADKQKEADMKAREQETYPERADAYLRDTYPDDTKRKARLEVESNLYKEFAAKSGVGTLLQESGLTSKPEFMHAIASWYESYASQQAESQHQGKANGLTGLAALYTKM